MIPALSRHPDRLQQMIQHVDEKISKLHDDSHPRLKRWAQYVRIFNRTFGRPPVVIVAAEGDEFPHQSTGDLLAAITQAATEIGCVVHPKDLHDTADVLSVSGGRRHSVVSGIGYGSNTVTSRRRVTSVSMARDLHGAMPSPSWALNLMLYYSTFRRMDLFRTYYPGNLYGNAVSLPHSSMIPNSPYPTLTSMPCP